jgi:hypothetical protein
MNVSPISSSAPVQAELQTPVAKAAVSQSASPAQPAYTVSLSSTAQKTAVVDADHDGDRH